ncbi:hypothetical protein I7I48_08281 [Histoplasma ohiense]|nr:hypothetical protein I7I48_08281 [Histoplasma ohiense (nom. inval.)]
MPFLLDFLFLSIFTLSPAPGHRFIVPNSDRVTKRYSFLHFCLLLSPSIVSLPHTFSRTFLSNR